MNMQKQCRLSPKGPPAHEHAKAALLAEKKKFLASPALPGVVGATLVLPGIFQGTRPCARSAQNLTSVR